MLGVTDKILEWCARALIGIGSVAVVLMMVHVMAEVLVRYFLTASIPGTEEIVSGYYMVAVVFLPLGYVQYERGHVIIELFTLKLSSRSKAWLDACVLAVCAAALSVFTYAGYVKALRMTARNEIWIGLIDVAIWPSRWMLPAGLLVMTLIMVVQSIQEFHSAITGKGHHEPRHAEDVESV
ncbi:MAG: TRAP transporter small permease [Hyphomicrobiales bacterium]|nr:TRAP transporter small permease [Hyphomicrobiales bacterium]MCP5370596.1 TRAP transporter small permease [Hyphomicrobiales bacterium]